MTLVHLWGDAEVTTYFYFVPLQNANKGWVYIKIKALGLKAYHYVFCVLAIMTRLDKLSLVVSPMPWPLAVSNDEKVAVQLLTDHAVSGYNYNFRQIPQILTRSQIKTLKKTTRSSHSPLTLQNITPTTRQQTKYPPDLTDQGHKPRSQPRDEEPNLDWS